MNNLIEKALVGKKYLKCSDLPVDGYFDCLKLIKPLLEVFDSSSSTLGFYINISGNNKNVRNVVRLTFFTNHPEETKKIIETFLKNHSNIVSLPVENFEDKKFKEPIECRVSEEDCERRFRLFLNTYTHIGLDLLESLGRLCTRRLIATYRFKDLPLPKQPKLFFEQTFNKHSDFFRQLKSDYSAQQLWQDLELVDSNEVWLHFFVNMLMPCDCCPNERGQIEYRYISEAEKRDFLNMIGLDLPDNWESGCKL